MYIMGKYIPDAGEPRNNNRKTTAVKKYNYRKGQNIDVIRGKNYEEAIAECNKFFEEMEAQYPTFKVINVTVSIFNYVDYTVVFKI